MEDLSGESEDEKKFRINLMKLSLEESFGSENVKYNFRNDFFEIKSIKNAYAISKNGKDDWKFLVLEKNQDIILKKLLPEELSSQIRKLFQDLSKLVLKRIFINHILLSSNFQYFSIANTSWYE